MGAWGVLAFDNDDACDWAYELERVDDFSSLKAAFDRRPDAGEYLEARDACVVLAAGEVLARLNGRGGVQNSYTEAVDLWVANHKFKPSVDLMERAMRAIERVLGENPKLRELWDESDSSQAWRDAVEDLRLRLEY
jgi:Domain of unknown function (DUF4259)